MRPVARLTALALLLGTLMPAAALTAAAKKTVTTPERRQALPPASGNHVGVSDGLAGSMTRLFIGLVVVVGIIVVVWLLLRKLQRSTMPGFGADAADLVNVVSSTTLGPGRFLHLVRVGEELVLVGATEHSVAPVLHIGAEVAAGVLADAPRDDAGPGDDRGGGPPRAARRPPTPAASIVERLRQLTTRR